MPGVFCWGSFWSHAEQGRPKSSSNISGEAPAMNVNAQETTNRLFTRYKGGETNGSEMRPTWTLVTSHGLVLFYVASHPSVTIREIATEVGLTERRVMEILKDLRDADLLSVVREGRRNSYSLNPDATFRHPHLAHVSVQAFLRLVREPDVMRQVAGV
jgi:hypothetical protein